jgi:penicillin-binding protein 2
MQVNLYTQLIANGGILYKQHLLQNAVSIEKKDFIPDKNIEIVKEGMEGACEPGGTGYPLFGFAVKNPNLKPDGLDYVEDASAGAGMVHVTNGCKTGTSEDGLVANPHAWFTIFAPFYNPEIAVTVLVENGGQGSDVAAPIARQILTSYFEGKKN